MTRKLATYFAAAAAAAVAAYALGNARAQQMPSVASSISALAQQSETISKLDWALLNARIRALEEMPVYGDQGVLNPVGIRYDAAAKRVRVSVIIDTGWLDGKSLHAVRDKLSGGAVTFCGVDVGSALNEAGYLGGMLNWKNTCAVDYSTNEVVKGELQHRAIATFENGQLVLK